MNSGKKTYIYYYLAALAGFIVTFSMVIYPENAFQAAVAGLDVWWRVVFPALLPFFIAAELLMGLGVVHFMGVLLEPMMRPLFKVPGTGSFVMAVGLASGFPIGSILTARLRRQNLCSKEEGERLMSFTNTADPLFMFGAVAVGMLAFPQIGYTIAAAHYLSSLTVGLLMRFHKPDAPPSSHSNGTKQFILARASRELIKARQSDDRPFGKVIGDAVRNSVNSLLLIGGFIIAFSVMIEIFNVSGVAGLISAATRMPQELVMLATNGILEISLGCQQAANSSLALGGKIIATSAIIAWSGLSVHGQVASIISDTDLDIRPYLVARIIHALLAGIYTAILFDLNLAPVFRGWLPNFAALPLGARYLLSARYLAVILALWVGAGILSTVFVFFSRVRVKAFRVNQS